MIKKTTQNFQLFSKAIKFSGFFQFSQQQKKIYEGLILTQKLKYTVKDNLEYCEIYNQNNNQTQQKLKSTDKYVNRMLLGSIFSRIIGSNLPLSIYLSQKIEIQKDIPLDTQVQGRVTIAKNLGKDRYLLITEVYGTNEFGQNEKYVNGQARIMIKGQQQNRKSNSYLKEKDTIVMNIQKSHLKLKSQYFIIFLAFSVAAGSFVMGYALVGTALLEEHIQTKNHIPHQQIHYYLSIVITLLPLGAIVGSLLSAKMVNIIGQKNSMILVDVLMTLALIAQSYSLDLQVMYVTRFIFGFFCGISSAIIPPYLTSISPLNMTGFIGSFNQLSITLGISVAYAMNFFLQSDIMQKKYQIALFLLVPLPFCILRIFVLGLLFPYDTAQRHFQRKQFQAVKGIMKAIYQKPSYEDFCKVKNLKQVQDLSPGTKEKNSDTSSNSSRVLTPYGKKRIMMIAIVIAISNQVSGINAIFFYAKQLFTNLTGGNQEWVQKDLFGLGIFQVLLTFISSFLLDKFGRRSLMLVGMSIMVFSLFAAYFATDVFSMASGIIVFFIFLHIFGFSISLGPICGLYASEIMQDISLVIILMWIETLVVAMLSDMMIKQLGIGKTFLIFGILSLGCLVYFWKEMIESKGHNRVQMQELYSSKSDTHVRINSTQEFQQMHEQMES